MGRPGETGGGFFYVLEDALSILYVDDDPILREFAQVHLTTEAASVHVAEDGEAGLALAADLRPDVILLDLEMPKLDGFGMLAALRADPVHERTPVIVQTGREDVAAIDRAFDAGATSFTIKPINWRLLSYQIRYVCRAHQAERSLLEGRRRARAEAAEAGAALAELADSGSRFLAAALRATPGLKTDAGPYLAALEAAARRRGSG